MPIIKDTNYWKEYNRKRKEYLQQKYLQRKQVVKSTTEALVVKNNPVVKSETVVENILQPDKEVVKSCKKIIQPELVVKKDSLQPKAILQPCQNCLQLKNTLANQIKEISDLKTKLNNNNTCSLNHISFKELFNQTSEQVKKDYQKIYQQYPPTAKLCINCHTYERNYQIMSNLLEAYAKETKKLNN